MRGRIQGPKDEKQIRRVLCALREWLIWNKMLYNLGGKWVWETFVVALVTATAVSHGYVQAAAATVAIVLLRWIVGWLDWKLHLTQTENELGLRKLNPYMEARLDGRKAKALLRKASR